MPVIDPTVVYVNQNLPEAYRQAGQGASALAAALLNYYRSRQPGPHQLVTPEYPERLRFPSGVTIPSPPQEIAAIQARGGVPTTTGQTVPFRTGFGTLFPRGGVSYVPPAIPLPEQIQRMANVATVQRAQQELELHPLEMEEKKAKIESTKASTELVNNLLKQGLLPVYDQSGNVVGARQTSPPEVPTTTESIVPSTETTPEELSLGQTAGFRAEQARRAVGRFVGTRQRQSALQNIFESRAVTIQKNLGDAANISEAEQARVIRTFPKDGESDISRQEKFSTGVGLFDTLEQRVQAVLQEPNRMVIKGLSKTGPRFEIDPAQLALKRKAVEDLAKIRQGRVLLKQMFDEAEEKMPPIPTGSQADQGTTASGLTYTIEE